MNDVRTFRADTMQQALEIVRRELGGDAVILHTRQVTQRRLLPWKKPIQKVEITAGLGINIRPPAARSQPAKPTPSAAKPVPKPPASPTKPAPSSPTNGHGPVIRAADPDVTFVRTATDAQVAAAAASIRNAAAPPNGTRNDSAGSSSSRNAVPNAVTASPSHEFASQLNTIQRMLHDLGRGPGGSSDVPAELFGLYTHLIDAEVEDGIARELVSRLRQSAGPEQLQDHAASLSLLTAMVEKDIRCSGPIAPAPGKRKVVALVGSTGVGKTTTIAKLAANLRLRDGVKMGLVTVDTYRIAAVEQLRTYAEIIDLPMKVVTSPPEMRRALDELVGLDLILIDTAGRSPRDELQIQELKSLLAEACVDEVHLVMSMTASTKSLEATAKKFAAAGTTSLIMTKLDEAAGMGAMLSVARKIPLPISYITTGQDVPDDIESANPTRIARLLLGREKLAGAGSF